MKRDDDTGQITEQYADEQFLDALVGTEQTTNDVVENVGQATSEPTNGFKSLQRTTKWSHAKWEESYFGASWKRANDDLPLIAVQKLDYHYA